MQSTVCVVFGWVNIPSPCQNTNVYIKTFFIIYFSLFYYFWFFLKSDFTCACTIFLKEFRTVSLYLIKSKGNFYKQKSVPLRKHTFLHGTSEHKSSKILLLRILSSAAVSVSDTRPWSPAELVPHSVPAKRQETCVLFVGYHLKTTFNHQNPTGYHADIIF